MRSPALASRAPLAAGLLAVLLLILAVAAIAPGARASDGQPGFDNRRLAYQPIGFFKPGDPLPANAPLKPTNGRRFNPTGTYNAFDSNVFEVLNLPFRGAGDKTTNDPPGNGGNPKHGLCAPNPEPRPGPEAPLSTVAGECPNHQLEYIDYYRETMQDILGDFGVTFRNYEFDNPGTGNTLAGRGINPAAIVPGADHPEETIVIGAHYDKTTEAPAAAWDSQEGHAQMIRVAKLMADYWRSTGTRPAATVKFIPWDGEESGTLGSLDYAENNIVPGEESKVRGYWNTDPCAGGYPAYRFGNPQDRVKLGIQLADPESIADVDTARIKAFNKKAPAYLESVFDRLDDKLTLDAGEREIFISTAEGKAADNSDIGRDVNIGLSRPVLFSSDWRNFEVLGIPFFNPGPEVTGPDSDNNPNTPDALAILHTPNDNLNTLNAYAGRGPSQLNGQTFAEGWIKGMEMCAQMLAEGMLQPDQGGTQTADPSVVAYYEALPNEAIANQKVTFDAGGSYQYDQIATRSSVPGDELEYRWDFGDGTSATGKTVQHAYKTIDVYRSTLTVTNTRTRQSDTMAVPITVIGSAFAAPVLKAPPATDEDGTFDLGWTFAGTRAGFEKFLVEEASDFRTALTEDAEGKPEDRWTVGKPTNDSIAPWQKSDSGTPKVRGNQRRGGATSFWTGIPANQSPPAGAVVQGTSTLTLKQALTVPKGSATLSYWSLFQNEGDDKGIVEVASAANPTDFKAVDTIAAVNTAVGETDEAVCDPSQPGTLQRGLVERRADLGAYTGQDVIVRFNMVYGPENRAASQPCGWYVDDIRITTGSFEPIGESLTKAFTVKDRPAGTYAYRIKGAYTDGVLTAASNEEPVRVTRATPGKEPAAPVTGSSACEPSNGFTGVVVKPRGRRLRLDFARRVLRPVTIEVFQASSGRRLLANRRVARFTGRERGVTWNGRSNRRTVRDGVFFVRFRVRQADGRTDTRRVTVVRRNGRFASSADFYGREVCRVLASAKLAAPVFGGPGTRALGIAFRMARTARVSVTVLKGKRVVKRFSARTRATKTTHRLTLSARGLARGSYRVRIQATGVGRAQTVTLLARRL